MFFEIFYLITDVLGEIFDTGEIVFISTAVRFVYTFLRLLKIARLGFGAFNLDAKNQSNANARGDTLVRATKKIYSSRDVRIFR